MKSKGQQGTSRRFVISKIMYHYCNVRNNSNEECMFLYEKAKYSKVSIISVNSCIFWTINQLSVKINEMNQNLI